MVVERSADWERNGMADIRMSSNASSVRGSDICSKLEDWLWRSTALESVLGTKRALGWVGEGSVHMRAE